MLLACNNIGAIRERVSSNAVAVSKWILDMDNGIYCEGYGTVTGCGKCVINLTSKDDLRHLSLSSLVQIARSIFWMGSDNVPYIDSSTYTVRCDSIITMNRHSRRDIMVTKYTEILRLWSSSKRDAGYPTCMVPISDHITRVKSLRRRREIAEEMVQFVKDLRFGDDELSNEYVF